MEKSRIAEEESILLTRKATEAEQECQRAHLMSAKSHEEKMILEQKVWIYFSSFHIMSHILNILEKFY